MKDDLKLAQHNSSTEYLLHHHILRHSIKDELHIKGIRSYLRIPTNTRI